MFALAYLALLLLAIATSFAHPTLSPRDDFWRCFALGYGTGSLFKCTSYLEDQDIHGSTFSIYAFGKVSIESAYLDDAMEAANSSMAVYKDFLDGKSLNVKVFVGDVVFDGTSGSYASTNDFSDTCQVEIVTQKPQDRSVQMDEVAFKQVMAHELYHCVQRSLGQKPGRDRGPLSHNISKWWIEGTAEYFGISIYQHGVPDWITTYQATIPLYTYGAPEVEGDGDKAWIYFQHLDANRRWSRRDIHDFMAKQTFVDTFPEELSRVSLESDFAANFPSFATSFLDNQIPDPDGFMIQNKYISTVEAKWFTVPTTPPGSPYPLEVKAKPWNIQELWKTSFEPGQIVTVEFAVDESTDDRTVLQYRKKEEGSVWKLLHHGETADLQNTDTTQCPVGSDEYDFLITTTFDPTLGTLNDAYAHATLSFTVTDPPTKRDDSCTPTTPTPPTDSISDTCLVGDWNLDITSLQAFMTERLTSTSGSGATISNLVVSGSSTFSVTSTFASTMTHDNLIISYDGDATEFTFHTEIDVNGSVTGGNATSSPSFTWANAVAIGTIHSSTTTSVLDTPLVLDFTMDGQYGNQTTAQYECAGSSLKMAGYVAGKYAWAYTWVKG